MDLKLPKKRTVDVPASILKKIFSYILDFIIVGIVLSPMSNLVNNMIPSELGFMEIYAYIQSNPSIYTLMIINSIFSGAMILLYFTIFEYKMSQTPGKMLIKIRTVPEKKAKVSFWNYLLSNITFIPVFPFIILWIIDPVHMMWSKSNQRLMEKIAKLLVVERYESY